MNNEQANEEVHEITKKASEHRKPVFDPTGRIEHLMDGERKLFDVRRHFIGLFFLYIQITFGIGLGLVMTLVFLPTMSDVFSWSADTATSLAALFSLIVISLGVIFLVLATRIYEGNQLIASDKNITLVNQISLFNRKISELSMANIEDVTSRQSGIFPTLFNYGTLHVETAGEQNNFIFPYCPNPNAYAKAVLDARTDFITKNGGH